MTDWLIRILGTSLLGLIATAMYWKLRRDQATGVVRRRDESGRELRTLRRKSDPAAFRRHVATQYFLIALMLLLALAVLLMPVAG
jgi:hypothetical protein